MRAVCSILAVLKRGTFRAFSLPFRAPFETWFRFERKGNISCKVNIFLSFSFLFFFFNHFILLLPWILNEIEPEAQSDSPGRNVHFIPTFNYYRPLDQRAKLASRRMNASVYKYSSKVSRELCLELLYIIGESDSENFAD